MNQPYQAPNADLTQGGDNHTTYQPRIMQASGRLGRVRYVVYAMTISLLVYVAIGVVGALVGMLSSEPGPLIYVVGLLAMVGGVFATVMSIIYGIRRLNDINASGWLILLLFVPIANFVIALILFFVPGSKGANKYGVKPTANSGGLIAALVVLLVLTVAWIGVMAAVAVPAYQDYVQRAQFESQYQSY
ncbi:DUF805 domain-containing protein [Alloalcanivorax mobilis]|uniref:DUF805 domain-containing protein n=1 Tax=Alloalcanivorax mobilis TaxID=2019569 RepID=UPI000B5B3DF4|nr:DUF805 domain-containing protein [Alloalcanivorax mobilis]ASK34276.1 cell division protein FtsK [Alcanivorax sp. N3-2A]|tara:strand:+ start:4971 stop:5537 length:567 start_codon:yes stop_codon:yes gene_type:complete